MSNGVKPPTVEELWGMLKTYEGRISDLENETSTQLKTIADLNAENSGWLKIYQRQQSEIAALKSEQSRLASLLQSFQDGNRA